MSESTYANHPRKMLADRIMVFGGILSAIAAAILAVGVGFGFFGRAEVMRDVVVPALLFGFAALATIVVSSLVQMSVPRD